MANYSRKRSFLALILLSFLDAASARSETSPPASLITPVPQATPLPSTQLQGPNLNENKKFLISLALKPQLATYDQSIAESSLITTRSYLAFSPLGLSLEGRTTNFPNFTLLVRLESTFREQWLSSSDTPSTIALRGAAGFHYHLLSQRLLSRPLRFSIGVRPEFNLIPYLVVSPSSALRSGVASSVVLPVIAAMEWDPMQRLTLQWTLGFGLPLFYRGALGDVITTRLGTHFSTDFEGLLSFTEIFSFVAGVSLRVEKFLGDQTASKQGEFSLFRIESDLHLGLALRL